LEFEIVVNVPWSAPEEFTIIGESECRTSEGMKRSSTYLYLTGDSENACATVPTQVLPLAIGNISNVTGSMAAGSAPACAGPMPGMHTGDYCPADFNFRHTEMLRMIELHGNTPGGALYHCDGSTDDGYAPGAGAANCAYHSLDFAHDAIPRDWRIDDVELDRAIEFYQANGYIASQASLDGWAPNLGPEALVLQAEDSIAGHRIRRIYPTTEIGDYLPRAYYGAKFEPIDQIWSGAGQGTYLDPATETIRFIDDYIAALPGYPPAMSMLYFGSGVNSFQFDTNNLPAGVTDDMDLYVRKLETELLDDGSAFLPQIAVGFAGAMRNCALDEVQRVVVPEGVLFKYCLGSFCTDPVSSDGTAQEHEDVLERHRNFKWITDPIEVTKSPSSSPPTFEIRFKDLNANLLDVVSANPSEVGAVIPGASVTVLQEGRRERVNIDIPLSLSDSDLLSINLDPQEVEASIQNLVQALQNVGRPFFLRLGFEANGLHNQFCPEYFRSTYQKVITELRKKEHGLEFASVWHVTTGYGFDFEPFYPGDEFVDWMGVSIFFNGDIQPGGSKYNNLLDLLTFAESHLKPVIICESAPIDYGVDVDEFPRTCDASGNNCTPCPVGYDLDGESGRCVEKAEASGNDGLALPSDAAAGQRAWDAWFGPYFNLIRTHPGIKAFSYINVDFKPKKTPYVPWKKDCQLAKNEYVRQHFQQEMENPIFLHAKEQYPRKDSVRTYMTAFQSKLKYPEFVISTLNRPNVMRFTSTHEFILGAENAKVVTGVQDFSAFEEDTNSWRVYTLTPQGPVLIAALDDQTGNLLLGGALHSMGAEDTEPLDLDQVPLDWVLKEDIRSGSGSYNTVRFAGFTASGDLYVRERFLTSENKRLWDGTQNPGFMYYGFPDYADVIGPDTYCPLGTGPTLEERCNCILGSPWWNHGTGFICHTMNSSGNAIEKAMYEVTKVFEEFYSGLDVLSVDRFGNVDLPIGAVLQGGIVAASATEERVLVECGGIPKAKLLIYDNNGTISADLWLAGEVTVASKPFGELATCGVEFVDEDAHVVAVLDALGNLLTEGLVRARGQYLMDVNNWPLPIGPKEDL
ncbi:MAG: hypothetical protein HYV27_09210, partial [Candidatus Hydrogenedentes bacterium]|nr:hypothetical protein [Candidatus Hydrogenedentota bacterium]